MVSGSGLAGKVSLLDAFPAIAAQLVNGNPSEIYPFSGQVFEWQCVNHPHTYTARVEHRTRLGTGCPFCSNRRLLRGFNDLATTHAEYARQLATLDGTTFVAGSNTPVEWRCDVPGHPTWVTKPTARIHKGRGCPTCAGVNVAAGVNDLATTDSELAGEMLDPDPRTVVRGSRLQALWQCQVDVRHQWRARVSNRVFLGRGCPYCAGQSVLLGVTDLATTHPGIAAQLRGTDPTTVHAGSARVLEWECPRNPKHVWKTTVRHRTGQKTVPKGSPRSESLRSATGCPFCSNKKVLVGENDFSTTHPALAAQIVDADPRHLTMGSDKKVRWQCQVDERHQWVASLSSRTGKWATGCAVCSNHTVIVGVNDLATTDPVLASQILDLDPMKVPSGSNKKARWRCATDSEHEWVATVASRAKSGCPFCAKYGYSPASPGIVYVQAVYRASDIRKKEVLAWKIGICNENLARRTAQLRRGLSKDYVLDTVFSVAGDGAAVLRTEREVLRWWRKTLQLKPFMSREAMKDGFFETVDASRVPLRRLKRHVVKTLRSGSRS